MPFVALHSKTQERVDITQINISDALTSDRYTCQLCNGEMYIRAVNSKYFQPHFVHYAECVSTYDHHPESLKHRLAKQHIREQLIGRPNYQEAVFHLEYIVPEAHRIADVYVKLLDGSTEVHEAQLASITTHELEQRTNDYGEAGLKTIWWLGGAAAHEHNKWWCSDRLGGCHLLSFSEADNDQQ